MITVELDNFSLKEICQSGQCFRMRETEENTYELIAGDQYLKLTQEGTIVTFYCSDVEFLCYWVPYFDLDADYGGYIEKINPRDRYLCAAAASGSGIRILRQDLWEMIITFLISQQNNITTDYVNGTVRRKCLWMAWNTGVFQLHSSWELRQKRNFVHLEWDIAPDIWWKLRRAF